MSCSAQKRNVHTSFGDWLKTKRRTFWRPNRSNNDILTYFPISSYSKVLEQKEQLEQKHLHLLQILDSERQAKWHYVQQTEELTAEVKKLKTEVSIAFYSILRR